VRDQYADDRRDQTDEDAGNACPEVVLMLQFALLVRAMRTLQRRTALGGGHSMQRQVAGEVGQSFSLPSW
jgi:hypothetical protein